MKFLHDWYKKRELKVFTQDAIPKFDCPLTPETISVKHRAIAITPSAPISQQTIASQKLFCVLAKMEPFLKKMPAPMHAPTTTTRQDMNPNCFFLGKSVTLLTFFLI
jgi:hypothetical protein